MGFHKVYDCYPQGLGWIASRIGIKFLQVLYGVSQGL